MLSYNQRPPRARRTDGEFSNKPSILSPRSPSSMTPSQRMLQAKEISADSFQTTDGSKYKLSDVVAQGQTADFRVAMLITPHGHSALGGLKELVSGQEADAKSEMEIMYEVGSPLTACVISTEKRKFLWLPLCDNVLSAAASQVHAAGLPDATIEAWAIDVLRQSAKRLCVMHKRNIAHRDVKPANIFVKLDGRIYVGDLGSAKNLNERVPLTGSPGFWTPRTLQGKAVSKADDV